MFKNDIEQHLLNFDSFKFEYKIDPHCFPSIVSLGPLEFETVTINRKYQHEEFECGLNQTKTIFLFTECCSSPDNDHCPGCDRCICSGCRLKNCLGPDSAQKKVNQKYKGYLTHAIFGIVLHYCNLCAHVLPK